MLPGYDWLRRNISDLGGEGGTMLERNRNPVMGGAAWVLSATLVAAWAFWLVPALLYRLIAHGRRRGQRSS
jgi:hypothetical protein